MPDVSIHLPLHLDNFASATGNRSGYITRLLEARQAQYAMACARIIDKYPHSAIMAVMDVLNGYVFTNGLDLADKIKASLKDNGGLQGKWDISDETWGCLLVMDATDASAFKILAEEFWAGREI